MIMIKYNYGRELIKVRFDCTNSNILYERIFEF